MASLSSAVEKKDCQLDELIRGSATVDPAVAASLAKRVEDAMEAKNAAIADLRREVAELCVAHNDLLKGNVSNAVPVRPSFVH